MDLDPANSTLDLLSSPAVVSFLNTTAGRTWRPTAMGIELIQTSADLYRGGMGYAYRIPGDPVEAAFLKLPGTSPQFAHGTVISYPPKVPASIVGYANTWRGDARAGVAAIGVPNDFMNRPKRSFPSGAYLQLPSGTGSSLIVGDIHDHPVMDWDPFGVFVTGLNPGATFVLRFNMAYEIFPLASDQLFITLAQPSVEPSPALEEAILQVLKTMPAGFDYRENPFGEWFSKIVDALAEYLPKIVPALQTIHPIAGISGQAAAMIAKEISSRNHKKSVKTEKRDRALQIAEAVRSHKK